MSQHLVDDPFVAGVIDDAVAPFEPLLVAEDRAWLHARLLELIEEDPEVRGLFLAAHPRNVDRSGEQLQPGAEPAGDHYEELGHG